MKVLQRLSFTRAAALCLFGLGTVATAATAGVLTAGTLTIGSDMTYPPYESLQDSKPVGFDPEFMAKAGAHMKLVPKFVDTRFANLILGATGGRYDVIVSALYMTPERAKTLDFIPYFMTGGSLLANSSTGFKPQSMNDLCGKKVASLKGAAWVPALHDVSTKVCEPEGKGKIDVREFDTSAEAAQALLSRAADAQYDDAGVAKMMVDKIGNRVVITSTSVLNPVVCGIAVRKGNSEVKALIEDAFNKMKANGEYQTLLKKYNLVEPSAQDIAKAGGKS
jgi:polar amino acid transport system substrate-binding protein